MKPNTKNERAQQLSQSLAATCEANDYGEFAETDAPQAAHEPTNAERCQRAERLLNSYSEDDAETNLIDFLADVMHWCQFTEIDFATALRIARMHYEAEFGEQE